MVEVQVERNYESWHEAARELLIRNLSPEHVQWRHRDDVQVALPLDVPAHALPSLPEAPLRPTGTADTPRVPRSFLTRARLAACHRDPLRWSLLNRLLWRLTHGERSVLDDPVDEDARLLDTMVRQVRRDEHKMHAFVRFRKMTDGDGDRFVAFHRPDHFIVPLAAPFFVERFRTMRWSILTPDECAHWDGAQLSFTEGVDASAAPDEDAIESVWRTYYASTFNPARVNTRAMVRELPVRHWRTLPEAQIIPDLVAAASSRVDRMLSEPGVATSARPFMPAAAATLDDLRNAAASCRGCPLFAEATQVVFGEGPPGARLMLVGEQPGDEEDLNGRPFVGPAGRVLADALEQAGLARADLYVTNAVKHFTFRREGKRRIHERPRMSNVRACRPWLASEIEQVKPAVIVCLGSTAAQAVLGPRVRIQKDRGRAFDSAWAKFVIPTYHPSAVLRAEDEQHGRDVFAWLVEDLRHAARLDATPTSRLP